MPEAKKHQDAQIGENEERKDPPSKKPGTIKTYANQSRNSLHYGELDFSFEDQLVKGKPVSQFEHMPSVLAKKQVQEGLIFVIDGDIDALVELIKTVKETDSYGLKIGVLFRANGHTTPFCIDKIIDEETEEEVVAVYNTDSVVMDIDAGDAVKQVVEEVAAKSGAIVYSLGIDDPKGAILRDYKRQSDTGSCTTYSLFDLEQLMNMDFHQFAAENSRRIKDNLFSLEKLPANLMAPIQSIEGKKEAGTFVRNGLKYAIDQDPNEAKKRFEVNGEITSLQNILKEVEEEGISNPIIDIMNQINLSLYDEATGLYDEDFLKKYKLTKEAFETKKGKEHISGLIHDIATQQWEEQESEDEKEIEEPVIVVKDKKKRDSIVKAVAMATVIVGIVALIMAIQMRDRDSESDLSEDDSKDGSQTDSDSDLPPPPPILEQEESGVDITKQEMADSAFGQGSNLAKGLRPNPRLSIISAEDKSKKLKGRSAAE